LDSVIGEYQSLVELDAQTFTGNWGDDGLFGFKERCLGLLDLFYCRVLASNVGARYAVAAWTVAASSRYTRWRNRRLG
jgi:hypothetical protein